MKLISDSGSTKTTWSLLSKNENPKRFTSNGINPFFQNPEQIQTTIEQELLSQLTVNPDSIEQIYFYGAGCTEEKSNDVKTALKAIFVKADIMVTSDMVGAAVATVGTNQGIVSILGTGSNSCMFKGGKVEEQISPLGFILGDEGSGAYMGKILLGDVLKFQAPKSIVEKFEQSYPNYNRGTVIQNVYKEEYPSRFLAQFTHFIKENIESEYCKNLVNKSFTEFITRNITNYSNHKSIHIHAVGSIAFHFKEQWSEALQQHDLLPGNTIQAPIDGLEKFFESK